MAIETRTNDEAGRAWLAERLAAGGYMIVNERQITELTGDDAPSPPEPPTTLDRRRFWMTAHDLGYKPAIDSMVAGMSERQQIIVREEIQFDRTNPLFAEFAAALRVTDEEIDAFFRYGAALT